MHAYADRLRSEDYSVCDTPLADARALIEKHHYAKGSSHTAVFVHGLYCNITGYLLGVVQWLPPTKPAAASVYPEEWMRVLSLSRMVVIPNVPKNACSFLMARSIQKIKKDGHWKALVTYADSRIGHDGLVYRASGWTYVGKSQPTPAWLDPNTGKQVAALSTKTRTKKQMLELGYVQVGKFHKYKFIKFLDKRGHRLHCEL